MKYMIASSLIFWLGWVILPLLVEFIPSVGNFLLLLFKYGRFKKDDFELTYPQNVTIIIPIYNSAATLYECIKSVNDSNYENKFLEIMCVDNGSKDNSFEIFQKAQMEFADLPMYFLKSQQGKSRALNMAVFNSTGKYIINIDSDGKLEKNAILNVVKKFEKGMQYDCLTGTILIEPRLVDETRRGLLRVFRKVEFMEYCQAFLAGRNYQSETNTIFTLSGAFSAFRKSTIFKTYMYNTDTICEDTHLTFQVKDVLKKRVGLCENAIFMVDPIDSINKYYTQRQRWQIGELEVLKMFVLRTMRNPLSMITKNSCRTLIQDHTMAFSKFVWIFITLLMALTNKMGKLVIISILVVYLLNLITSFMYSLNVLTFLRDFKDIRDYYFKNYIFLLLLPMYNLFTYFIRVCGILNSVDRKASWRTLDFNDEKREIREEIEENFSFLTHISKVVRKVLERDDIPV